MKKEKYNASMINMSGTSMGSYDKPMMKGGPMMKSGCQLSKHMKSSGVSMMGKKSCS